MNPTTSREIIEQEFANLKLLFHNPDPSLMTNDSTIFTNTILNGSFEKTIIIRHIDDTFISFDCTICIVSTLSEFWQTYDEHKDTNNVLIDSRLDHFIAYAAIKYSDNVLIYDSYTGKVKTIYTYVSDLFHIQTNELTITQIKKLFIMYLLVIIYAKALNINWNVTTLIRLIKQIYNDSPQDMTDIIITYIKIQTQSSINSSNVKNILILINDAFASSAYESESAPTIKPWDIDNVTGYEFFIALSILRNNNYHFAYI